MAAVSKSHSISIRIFGFLRRYMDTQGLSYAFDKDIDPKGEPAYDIAVELHIPPKEIEAVFVNGSVKNIYDSVFPGDRVAFIPYGTPGPYRVFLGMVRKNIERERKMQINIQELIRSKSKKVMDTSGHEARVMEDAYALEIAKECGCNVYDVYVNALKEGICPYRYFRNRETISLKEQLRLAESRVAVIGAGGLGGQVYGKIHNYFMLSNYRHGLATSAKISQRIRQYPELICHLCFTSGSYTSKGP